MSRAISEEEWEADGRIDRETPWTALSDRDLIECQDGIAHLGGPGFAYYLGALLRFAVQHLDAGMWTPEGSFVGSVLFFLTSHPTREAGGWLNAPQIAVVQTFLEHVVAQSEEYRADAGRALDRYWYEAKSQEPDYCPVCAYALPLPAQGDRTPRNDVCPCCGIRFGIDDAAGGYLVRGTIYRHWRAQWFSAGMPWQSRDVPKPEGWSPAVQLKRLRRKR